MQTFELRLIGGLTGSLWMPAVQGAKPIDVDLYREMQRFTDPTDVTLRDLLLHIQMEQGGDFQGADFTGDSFIRVTSRKPGRSRSRDWPITSFPSIKDMVAEEVFTYDFNGDDDY